MSHAHKRTFTVGRRCLVYAWILPDGTYQGTLQRSEQGAPATVAGVLPNGVARVTFDDPDRGAGYVLTKDCRFHFRDPNSPSAKAAREAKARAMAKKLAPPEPRDNRVALALTRSELAAILKLAAAYTEEDRRNGAKNPGVTTAEAMRRATLEMVGIKFGDWRVAERPKTSLGRTG